MATVDIGPGSGYFVDNAAPGGTQITLLDPNRHVLAYCQRRLSRFKPVLVEADVLKPLPVQGTFDSVALSFVLHCLPGPMENKAPAIRHIAAVLEPDGVLFGGTVLGKEEHHTASARSFLKAANRQGAFDNLTDTLQGLEAVLSESFESVQAEVVGSLALFSATDTKLAPG